MLKTRKLHKIAIMSAILSNLFRNYLLRAQKSGAFCSTVQKSYRLFCVGSLKNRHCEYILKWNLHCNPGERK